MREDTRVEWREWGADAFAEAEREGKPVLLALSATWCDTCHDMDEETYGEPRIAANLNDGFVPVRVDVDRHPRVRERYNMGGFPSTVFATPDGEVITGATTIGPDSMRRVIDRVRRVWDEKGVEAGRIPRALAGDPTPAGEVTDRIEAHLAGQLDVKFDGDAGGWGDEAKFPLPRTIEFALKRERRQALRTLDAIEAHLFDAVEGGFYRFAESPDWSGVHHEKLTSDNAALLRAFANGYLYTGDESYRDVAAATVEFLTDDLWNGAAVGASQGAAGEGYYALDAAERAERPGPRTDLTAYAAGNGLAADALLAYHAYTDDERAREYATRTLEFLRGHLVDDDGVVTHCRDDDCERLLLEDHASVAAAFVRAEQVLGGGDHLDVARRVADAAVESLGDEGSFLDGVTDGPGLLDRPFRPLDDNVRMADTLVDLWVLTDEERYREEAREAVAAFAGAWDRIGVQVAGYGSVAARLTRDPLVVDVADAGSDLHRAALRIADHETVVRPGADVEGAVVRVGDDRYPATSPDELMAQVADATE
jgi:hypothetical protein